MRTALRYVAMQIPGWLVVGAMAWGLWWHELVGGPTAGVLVGVWVLKDLALYPYLRRAYEPSRSPADALVGREATVSTALTPEGWVRIGPELWRARLPREAPPAAAGETVVVAAVEGLTLLVRTR
jgi:membrane protein implicated in regulation of membrane protease activity